MAALLLAPSSVSATTYAGAVEDTLAPSVQVMWFFSAPILSSTSSETARTTTRIAFASTPIVLYAKERPGPDNYGYRVIFKTTRRLPETTPLRVSATVLAGGSGSMFSLARFAKTRPCYESIIDDARPGSPLDHPYPGKPVKVTMRLRGHPSVTATVTARLRRSSTRELRSPGARLVARIGCAGERPS